MEYSGCADWRAELSLWVLRAVRTGLGTKRLFNPLEGVGSSCSVAFAPT